MHHTTSPPAGQASRRRVWHTQPPRPATQVHAIRVRPGKAADVESIAAVCGEVSDGWTATSPALTTAWQQHRAALATAQAVRRYSSTPGYAHSASAGKWIPRLCCAPQAFGTGHFPGLEHPSLTKLEERYTKAIDREIKQKVVEALDRKQKVRLCCLDRVRAAADTHSRARTCSHIVCTVS